MPAFTWTYTDPDGDPQAAFQFQIATENTFLALERDSGKVQSAQSTYTENNALQSQAEPYYARVKVWDSKGAESGWSDPIMFTITGPQVISYEYDQTGNRTKKIDGDKTTTYNYNGMNQLISMTENGVTTNFFYDANGNQIRKEKVGLEKWYYTYDFENRLTKVEHFDGSQTSTLGEYFYDGDGKRIKKVEASQTTIYIYLGWSIIYERESSTMTETKHVFGPNGHVAKIAGQTKYYYHSDHLGSLKQETDEAGNALWSSPAQYDPFGEMRSGGPEQDGYFYTGKLRDASTGLYYYGARYYDAKVGRFITKDSYTFLPDDERLHDYKGNYEKINSKIDKWIFIPYKFNLYVYVGNNPLIRTDRDGHGWVDVILDILEYIIGLIYDPQKAKEDWEAWNEKRGENLFLETCPTPQETNPGVVSIVGDPVGYFHDWLGNMIGTYKKRGYSFVQLQIAVGKLKNFIQKNYGPSSPEYEKFLKELWQDEEIDEKDYDGDGSIGEPGKGNKVNP